MFDQYLSAKKDHPDALMFFRMGDFYEMFFEDAQIASRVLGITLTCRNKNADNPIPMAGIPVKAADGYLAKMIRAGYRVAICEQVEDPRKAKGLVARKVVRIVTPGTLTEDDVLDERSNNFLAAVMPGKKQYGLAWVDLSTGLFEVTEVIRDKLCDEVARLSPAEILLPEDERGLEGGIELALRETTPAMATFTPRWAYGRETAYEALTRHFGTSNLSGFDCETLGAEGIGAAGAILHYLGETQRVALRHIRTLRRLHPGLHMHLDRATQHCLELSRTLRGLRGSGTLLGVLDETRTAMGSRLLASWIRSPLVQIEAINARLDAVQSLYDADGVRARLRQSLRDVADLERIASRLGCERAGARDLAALGRSLTAIPPVIALLEQLNAPALRRQIGELDPLTELSALIERALVDDPPMTLKEGGLIRTGYHDELDELHGIKRDARSWIAEYQARLASESGIDSLKVGYNRVFGYYVEVTHSNASRVPDSFIRRQTLKNAERYITPELKEFEEKALSADERIRELEYDLFLELRAQAAAALARIQDTARALAHLDLIQTLAEVARERRYVRPILDDGVALEIVAGRHPVLELSERQFVPNDTHIERLHPIQILTGPNMAGKSTYIRQVALIVLMAQTGSFVPAETARIGLVDRIFTRIGSADELSKGNSTFMVEMNETANILNHATERSLVILDEVGRGTSTFDGVAIAWALTEYLRSEIVARTLFATHYHELTDLARIYPEVVNYQVAVRDEGQRVIFLHRITAGGTDRSYGIHVAQLAGIPTEVITRATEILERLEKDAPDPTGRKNPEARRVPRTKKRQTSLLFDLYDSTLELLQDLHPDDMTPEEAHLALKRLKAEMDS